MTADAWVGIGLTVLGVGAPTTAALLRLLPSRNAPPILACPVREHEARMGSIEKDIAVLQENSAMIKSTLLRIEHKLDVCNGYHHKEE